MEPYWCPAARRTRKEESHPVVIAREPDPYIGIAWAAAWPDRIRPHVLGSRTPFHGIHRPAAPVIALITNGRTSPGRAEADDSAAKVARARLAGSARHAQKQARAIMATRRVRTASPALRVPNVYTTLTPPLSSGVSRMTREITNGSLVRGDAVPSEFTSTPRDGHPLFTGFVKAARTHRTAQLPEVASA